MKNKINTFIQKNRLFFFIFTVGILITLPSIIPSFNMDAYCTISSNFLSSVKTFMKSGRIFTALSYFLAHKMNLSFSIFSIISIITANLFLSLSIYQLFEYLKKYVENNLLYQSFLLIGTFLLIYNPLVIELLLFEEAFIMCLGIYFVVLSTLNFMKYNKKHLFFSLLLSIFGCICYQGIMCFYIPILFMLVVFELKGNIKKDYIDILKKGIKAILFYGISLIISFFIVKFINKFIYTDGTEKLGTIHILYNMRKAIELMFFSLKGMFGFVNKPIFYGSFLSLFLLTIFGNKEKKDDFYWSKVLYLSINILLCIGMPFVPNLGMNSAMNYTAARMIVSIGSIIGLTIIYATVYFDSISLKNTKKLLILLVTVYSVYNGFNFFYTSYVGLKRYENDMKSIQIIHEKIKEYEIQYGIKVKTIKYDSKANNYYYEYGITNSYNYRVYATAWAMKCAINMGKDKYEYIEMTDEEKDTYFGDIKYIEDSQFIFENDTLYLMLY